MKIVKGYNLIDLDLGLGGAVQTLFFKEHIIKVEDNQNELFEAGKTLFIGNIDFGRRFTNEQIEEFLRDLLICFGDINTISLSHYTHSNIQQSGKLSRFAHVTFKKKKSLQAVLNASSSMFADISNTISQKWGISHLLRPKKYKEILRSSREQTEDIESLKRKVDSVLDEYDMNEKAELEEQEKRYSQVDEDGFQMVKPRNKRKRSESVKRGTGAPRERKEKKKDTQLPNFYGHQMREQKRGQLIELRKKFEEDKKKVAELKAARKFKPF